MSFHLRSSDEDFLVLGIESSCDETAAAVVSSSKKILSNVIYSQISEHKKFNGVVPEIAARAHLEKIDYVVRTALSDANVKIPDLSAIAGTCGPGLIGGVIVGANFSKGISLVSGLPFIAVNHIEAHALTVRLTDNNIKFPYLLLLASGGHCQLCIVYSFDDFEVIGRTLDDSIGESFDKVAKMLNLGYPGGPLVEKMALKGNEQRFLFPHPLCNKSSIDFSFSGLKTAVKIAAEKERNTNLSELSEQNKADICASFQKTVADILLYKMNQAFEYCENHDILFNTAVIAGGVAANKYIRNALNNLCIKRNIRFVAPPVSLCTDNGAMIAWMGVEKFSKGLFNSLDFQPRPRWPLSSKKS
ncbi:MAG: tRNA (adenosine(37)-N6)-threonylcarbamoyltransferase complex transferase subunit TsaD [Alphaproteobacteria bacterium]|nr:tRNA (adenosine(37)-N6)-threonylcarbamoyltransferase complex transferase subunit TsaD [Alphaproteobacteria bacterium]